MDPYERIAVLQDSIERGFLREKDLREEVSSQISEISQLKTRVEEAERYVGYMDFIVLRVDRLVYFHSSQANQSFWSVHLSNNQTYEGQVLPHVLDEAIENLPREAEDD